MKESLYIIPQGCICFGEGLMGVKCSATLHAFLKPKFRWIPCDPGWEAVCNCGWVSKRLPMNLVEKEMESHRCPGDSE